MSADACICRRLCPAFKIVRDLIVFTRCGLILVDKQGLTGKKLALVARIGGFE